MTDIHADEATLRRVRRLLEVVLADLAHKAPLSEVQAELEAASKSDLMLAREMVIEALKQKVDPLPLRVVDGGLRFEDWLTDRVELDHTRARRILHFIDEYGEIADRLGPQPTIPELASETGDSVATVNRRLAEFRSLFPTERNPGRLARELRRALNDAALWPSPDEQVEAHIGDVPVA